MILIFHLKRHRFYVFLHEIKSNYKEGIYFEGDVETLKSSLLNNKNIIYFEFTKKRKKYLKIGLKTSLIMLFFWYEYHFFINIFLIILRFFKHV